MQQPLFSVLIANFNNGKFLSACLESIAQQHYRNIEIILVDDASTDHSLEMIQQYQTKDERIKWFGNEQNQGVGFTKTRCIAEASGAICGFVDPDDTITPDAIEKMVEAHTKHPEAALIYSNYYECDEQLRITRTYQSKQVINQQYDFFNEAGEIGPFATFKLASYQQTVGLNSSLKRAIDQDLYLKLYDIGPCLHLPATLYYYRMHANGLATQAQANLAYYWYWVVCILRAQQKGINLESKFDHTFVRKSQVNYLLKVDRLLKRTWLYQIYRKLK